MAGQWGRAPGLGGGLLAPRPRLLCCGEAERGQATSRQPPPFSSQKGCHLLPRGPELGPHGYHLILAAQR